MNDEEENIEIKSRLPREKLGAIRILKKSGWTNTDVSVALDIDRKTVGRYTVSERESEEKERKEEPRESQPVQISGEEYRTLYQLFEEGKSKVEAVIETGKTADVVDRIYEHYCADNEMPLPEDALKDIENITENMNSVKKVLNDTTLVLLNFLINVPRAIDSVLCPHCKKFTHLIKNEQGIYVCEKCGKQPFTSL